MTSLYIVTTPEIKKMYENYMKNVENKNENSGFDLLIPDDYWNHMSVNSNHNHGFKVDSMNNVVNTKKMTIDHKVAVMVLDKHNQRRGFWMVPRSSISKTNFRMANSIGLIDPGYNGNLLAKVDIIKNMKQDVLIKKGTRLFQICSHNLKPFKNVKFVSSLPNTTRGTGGFGSTDKQFECKNEISELGYVI